MIDQIEFRRPSKMAKTHPHPLWNAIPEDMFASIFGKMWKKHESTGKYLAHLCRVCRRWADCCVHVKLVLTNVSGLSMHHLFGDNRFGIQTFIANQKEELKALSISDGGDLPIHSSSFKLTQLRALRLGKCLESHWEWISNLPQLSTLCFDPVGVVAFEPEPSADLYAKALSCFATMTSLTSLEVRGIRRHLDDNLTMLTALTSLKSFNHSFLDLKDEGLKNLSLFTQLERLELRPCHTATPDGYKCLASLTRLKKLEISYSWDKQALMGLRCLEKLVLLESLRIENFENYPFAFADEELRCLASLSNLQELALVAWNLKGDGFKFLHHLTKLKSLWLQGCREAIALQHLAKLTHLTAFICIGNTVSEESVPFLSTLTNLKTLEICGCQGIFPSGIEFIRHSTRLTYLSLDDPALTDIVFEAISPLVNLVELNVQDSDFTDTALVCLGSLTKLQTLSFIECSLSGVGFKYLTHLTSLSSLDLTSSKIADAALSQLAALNLQILNLGDTSLTDEAISSLALLTSLRTLDLHDCAGMTAESLFALTSLKHLESLSVCVPASRWLGPLKAAFRHVEDLSMDADQLDLDA